MALSRILSPLSRQTETPNTEHIVHSQTCDDYSTLVDPTKSPIQQVQTFDHVQ